MRVQKFVIPVFGLALILASAVSLLIVWAAPDGPPPGFDPTGPAQQQPVERPVSAADEAGTGANVITGPPQEQAVELPVPPAPETALSRIHRRRASG